MIQNPYTQASSDEKLRTEEDMAYEMPEYLSTQEKERRGRSPVQPRQQKLDVRKSYEIISPNLNHHEKNIKYFDDEVKRKLHE